MDIDTIYGFYTNPYNGIQYEFIDEYQYLQSLNPTTYTKEFQQFIINEKEIDQQVKEKYLKYKEKEPQPPAGSGYMKYSRPPKEQMEAIPKFKFRR